MVGSHRNPLGSYLQVCVSMCMFAMDFEFILKVAEKRIKAALGKTDAGKIYFTSVTASRSAEAAGFSHGPGLVKKKKKAVKTT